MRNIILICIILHIKLMLFAQPVRMSQEAIDSISKVRNQDLKDTSEVNALYWLSRTSTLGNPNESIEFGIKGLELAKEIGFSIGEIKCLEALSFSYAITASFEEGIKTAYEQIELSRKYAPIREIFGINMMGLLYQKLGDDNEALKWAKKAYYHPKMRESDPFTQWSAVFLLAQEHERKNHLDSAFNFAEETLEYSKVHFPSQAEYPILILARISSKRGDFDKAVNYCEQIISESDKKSYDFFDNEVQNELAQIYFSQNQIDSAQHYADLALKGAQILNNYHVIMNAGNVLSQIYEKKNPLQAYELLKVSMAAKDTVINIEKSKQVKQLEIKEKQRIEELNLAEIYAKNEIRFNSVIGLLIGAFVISIILYRNNRKEQRINRALEVSLSNLKDTQAQLVQSEKLASLGELTAGIAHEIQNPLNFVNNFSDLNDELLDEAKEELKNDNKEEAVEIINGLKGNLQKISRHGRRASEIVKSMLDHSKVSSDEKVLTDINALSDEYFKLSINSAKAKVKSFDVVFETQYEKDLPKLYVIPRDIGKVLMNVFNNAFYAVERKKELKDCPEYESKVMVRTQFQSTSKEEDFIEIIIADNGIGMSQLSMDRVFEPFYTTRPTGEGTGLGMSISYDIVTKGHGGEIKIESEEGKGSKFMVILPL